MNQGLNDKVKKILEGHKYILLTSFRKDGTGVPTPIWFAFPDEKIYFYTNSKAWKIKRIQNTPKVEICPCTSKGEVLGDSFEAEAKRLDGQDAEMARKHLTKKYGMTFRLIRFFSKVIFFEVTPRSLK